MRSTSVSALAALALAGGSVADELRPRYYFPSEIRRPIYTNSTLVSRQTTEASSSSADLLGPLGSLLSGVVGQEPTIPPPSASPAPVSSSGPGVVVIPITVAVLPGGHTTTITGTPSSSGFATATAQSVVATSVVPTPSAAASVLPSAAEPDPSGTTASTTTSAGLLAGLGNDVSSLLNPGNPGSTGGLPATIIQPTTSSASPLIPATTETPGVVGTTGGLPATIVQPTTAPSSASSSSGLDLSGLVSGVGGALVGSTGLVPLQQGSTPTPSPSGGITVGVSSVISPTPTTGATPSSAEGLLPSILPGILGSDNSTTASTGPITIPVVVPTIKPSPSPSSPGVSPSPTGGSSPGGSPSPTPVSGTQPGSTPGSTPAVSSGTPTPVQTTSPTTVSPTPSKTTHESTPSPTHEKTTTSSSSTASTSIAQPSQSDTSTYVPPPSIIVQPTTTASATTTQPTATSTEIPQVIAPAGGIPAAPQNSTLIQLGFNHLLPYPFVATMASSSSQILYYTPLGLEYALQIPGTQVVPYLIRPYDTSKTLGYVTTLVQLYIPSDQVDPLALQLHAPESRLFQQQDPSIKTLFSMINPEIPLVVGEGGADISGTSGNSGAAGASGSDGADGNGSNSSDGNDAAGAGSSGGTVRGSSVGIGVGVVAGAAAYGAGMFYVARRYRKRRQMHQRTSSLPGQQMGETSGGSIFRAISPYGRNSRHSGRSNRTQMISAPVMAENSLGWN